MYDKKISVKIKRNYAYKINYLFAKKSRVYDYFFNFSIIISKYTWRKNCTKKSQYVLYCELIFFTRHAKYLHLIVRHCGITLFVFLQRDNSEFS